MDNDDTSLQNALEVLRKRYGGQTGNPRRVTEAEVSQALQDEMHLDAIAADRMIMRLYDSGQLIQSGSDRAENDLGTNSLGIVIEMPGAEAPFAEIQLLTTTLPGLLPSSSTNPAGGATAGYPIGAKAADVAVTGGGSVPEGPITEDDLKRNVPETSEGATMGQLGDTNVEGRDS